MAQVNLAKQDFFFVMRCLCQHSTERIAEERSSPELESLAGSRIAADVARLKAHSVHDTDIHPIGNRMRALNGAPGIVLRNAKLGLLRGMPPNGSWIEENARSLQRGESCAFGIPLIPTHQCAEPSRRGIEGLESEIAGSEIKLFVVEGVVGDMHLPIDSAQRSVRIENRSGVVINARRALFEERGHEHDFILARGSGKSFCGGTGDWFGEIEQRCILALAEVLRLEQFRQADDVGTALGRIGNAVERLRQVVRGFGAARHLHESDGKFIGQESPNGTSKTRHAASLQMYSRVLEYQSGGCGTCMSQHLRRKSRPASLASSKLFLPSTFYSL